MVWSKLKWCWPGAKQTPHKRSIIAVRFIRSHIALSCTFGLLTNMDYFLHSENFDGIFVIFVIKHIDEATTSSNGISPTTALHSDVEEEERMEAGGAGGALLTSDPPGFHCRAPSSHCASPQRPAGRERRPGRWLGVRRLSAAFATPPGGPAGTQRRLLSELREGAAGPDLALTPGCPPIKTQVTSGNIHPKLLSWKQTKQGKSSTI